MTVNLILLLPEIRRVQRSFWKMRFVVRDVAVNDRKVRIKVVQISLSAGGKCWIMLL